MCLSKSKFAWQDEQASSTSCNMTKRTARCSTETSSWPSFRPVPYLSPISASRSEFDALAIRRSRFARRLHLQFRASLVSHCWKLVSVAAGLIVTLVITQTRPLGRKLDVWEPMKSRVYRHAENRQICNRHGNLPRGFVPRPLSAQGSHLSASCLFK